MIQYTWKGEPFNSDRDVIGEFCEMHNETYLEEAIRKSGYNTICKVGHPEVAEIEMYFSSQRDTEFAAVAVLSLGDSIEGYVFAKHHDAVVFLKDFSPMIESIINVQVTVNKEG